MVINHVAKGSCVSRGEQHRIRQNWNPYIFVQQNALLDIKNLDYWYLFNKYSPKTQNFDVFCTSWMKSLIKMRKLNNCPTCFSAVGKKKALSLKILLKIGIDSKLGGKYALDSKIIWSSALDRKQDLNVLYQVCVFQADRKNKMAALASDWLRHFRLLRWNRWTEFNETWQEARSERLLPSLCFSGRSEKQDGRPGLWLAETFSTSPQKPLNGIQRNLTRSKISTSSTKFVFFRPIGKTRWPPWPLIGWDIFDFSAETA